ncbi:hypothetical protein [Photobacterium nomapromontoriensis]|uniref:hypothetical protein n=1 Tax=Photobacterium nomapromontoriensis TaxID=2910237 RepID=UPI003D100188
MFELNEDQIKMVSGAGCGHTDEEGRPIHTVGTDEEGRPTGGCPGSEEDYYR